MLHFCGDRFFNYSDFAIFISNSVSALQMAKHLRLLSFGAPRQARETKSFPTEIEAKQFAIAMLSEGRKVTAGT
jgi:hypothetical protein